MSKMYAAPVAGRNMLRSIIRPSDWRFARSLRPRWLKCSVSSPSHIRQASAGLAYLRARDAGAVLVHGVADVHHAQNVQHDGREEQQNKQNHQETSGTHRECLVRRRLLVGHLRGHATSARKVSGSWFEHSRVLSWRSPSRHRRRRLEVRFTMIQSSTSARTSLIAPSVVS